MELKVERAYHQQPYQLQHILLLLEIKKNVETCRVNQIATSGSKLRPSSWQICSIRVVMISSDSGLNLNLAHLEARGSMILHRK